MEMGIHKGRGEGPEGTLLIYDHWGEYIRCQKTRRLVYAVYPRIYPQYTTGIAAMHTADLFKLQNNVTKSM